MARGVPGYGANPSKSEAVSTHWGGNLVPTAGPARLVRDNEAAASADGYAMVIGEAVPLVRRGSENGDSGIRPDCAGHK